MFGTTVARTLGRLGTLIKRTLSQVARRDTSAAGQCNLVVDGRYHSLFYAQASCTRAARHRLHGQIGLYEADDRKDMLAPQSISKPQTTAPPIALSPPRGILSRRCASIATMPCTINAILSPLHDDLKPLFTRDDAFSWLRGSTPRRRAYCHFISASLT